MFKVCMIGIWVLSYSKSVKSDLYCQSCDRCQLWSRGLAGHAKHTMLTLINNYNTVYH